MVKNCPVVLVQTQLSEFLVSEGVLLTLARLQTIESAESLSTIFAKQT